MPQYFTDTYVTVPRTTLPVGFNGRSPLVADLNGDGKQDLLFDYFVLPTRDLTVGWRALLGDGQGGFTEATSSVFPAGAPSNVWPGPFIAQDFNGDGRLDFFAADWGEDQKPFPGGLNSLALSQAGGGYVDASSHLPRTIGNTYYAAAADIDRDGDVDLFIGDTRPGASAYFLINDGTGAFTQDYTRADVPKPPGGNFYYTNSLFFDANGDGKPDLFLATPAGDVYGSRLFLNDGTGHFTSKVSTIPSPAGVLAATHHYIEALVSVDLNGDGRLDLVAGWQINSYESGRLQALINDGQGGFTDQTDTYLVGATTTKEVSGLQLIDVNGDGLRDLVLNFGDRAPIWLNDGTGRLIHLPVDVLEFPNYATAADVNSDGLVDFVEGSGGSADGPEFIRLHLGNALAASQQGSDAGEGMMAGPSASTLMGGAGDDVIVGSTGRDYLRGELGNDCLYGGEAFDDINGNQGDDTAYGGGGGDWVVGGKDNDLLYGEAGGDVVYGNLGNDTVSGGDGDDWVRGGQGDDSVSGGAGDDLIWGDRGSDTLSGGAGADHFSTFSGAGLDRVLDFSAAQGDRVVVEGGAAYSVAQSGADVVVSLAGGDSLVLVGVNLASLSAGWLIAS